MILITGPKGDRRVEPGVAYRLGEGERVVGNTKILQPDKLDNMATDATIGVGDLIHAVTRATGFKEWWYKVHGGGCLPCQKRQAALNYLQFKGPQWVHDWVENQKEKGK